MSYATFLPRKDADLAAFANNMSTYLTASPAAFSVTIAQAAAFATLKTAFQTALTTLENPANRNPVNTQIKNDARAALVDGPGGIRELVDIIQAAPATTDVQRQQIQITIRDTDPTPSPIPDAAPVFTIESVIGQTVVCRIRNAEDETSRAKPFGVQGAQILAYLGDEAPLILNQWQTMGVFTRTDGTVTLMLSSNLFPPGSKVWLTASWMNTRGQQGPLSNPIAFFVAGGLSEAA